MATPEPASRAVDVPCVRDSPSNQTKGHGGRQLTDVEWQKLNADTALVSDFKQAKLEKEARKNWDLFYKRNSTNFFKDRHWTSREFGELAEIETKDESRSAQRILLEVGCGVGNAVFPLLEENRQLFVYACDFSPRAVQFVKDNSAYDPARMSAFQCDLTSDPLRRSIPECNVDIVTMLFVLSAIHPEKMLAALKNVFDVLRPGGCVLFRDYGLYDHAMLRFNKGHKLADNFYVRQDGTRAYYFTEEYLSKLFTDVGFDVASNEYVLRETVNKKEGLCVPRVFVQGKFIKPSQSPSRVTKLLNADEEKMVSQISADV
ncbi:tRNA N(3)-methylcytidine methyltransferase METTL6-like [Patiria miniata]|uniref:tRNA N(3)-methylcytidine methyltransferase n=1 Tax=Patiria miniata TaxID=46514 RepID=A0A914BL58_PATMI|nr:tRNA N(3)-methylcytidine methyltransferase METTL6-like [Patiria miniata]XP_038077023.1 tRNA N(3)-methylcytidine methyltransferase METTL6-like [Patiria miniata]